MATKFVKNLHFFEFKKEWNMTHFKAKNLCDKGWKIQNLRWQFSCIFRCRRHGYSVFFVTFVFMKKFADQNCIFSNFSKKSQKRAFLNSKIHPLGIFPPIFFKPCSRPVQGFCFVPQNFDQELKKAVEIQDCSYDRFNLFEDTKNLIEDTVTYFRPLVIWIVLHTMPR